MLMTVDIRSAPREALTVPELAVIGEGSGAFVWKVDDANEASRVEIRAGTRRDGRVEVLSGLEEGARIVSEGTVKLRGPGPVKPVERAAAAPQPAEAGAEAGGTQPDAAGRAAA
jgi:membrane fusion protein (multidrug efflux system)